jgi:hypothetical protein
MAQKRTDYSKFTRSNGTIQVLMLWASVGLHLAIGSNLGLFGRLDPIKVKPAGGTVRVVDLTPAEQTRVPEAAKAKPLPIAPISVNPEIATRTPVNSTNVGRSGASNFVPPRVDRPQLPTPSSQVPRTPFNRTPTQPPQQPISPNPLTDNKKNRVDIPIIKPPKVSQDDPGVQSGNGNSQGGSTKKRQNTDSSPDISTNNQDATPDLAKPTKQPNGSNNQGTQGTPKPPTEEIVNDSIEEQKEINMVLSNLQRSGVFLVRLEIPKASLQKSSCNKYKKVRVLWPIEESGELSDVTPIFLPSKKINENYSDSAKLLVKSSYDQKPLEEKKKLAIKKIVNGKPVNNFADYSFQIPFGSCNN